MIEARIDSASDCSVRARGSTRVQYGDEFELKLWKAIAASGPKASPVTAVAWVIVQRLSCRDLASNNWPVTGLNNRVTGVFFRGQGQVDVFCSALRACEHSPDWRIAVHRVRL